LPAAAVWALVKPACTRRDQRSAAAANCLLDRLWAGPCQVLSRCRRGLDAGHPLQIELGPRSLRCWCERPPPRCANVGVGVVLPPASAVAWQPAGPVDRSGAARLKSRGLQPRRNPVSGAGPDDRRRHLISRTLEGWRSKRQPTGAAQGALNRACRPGDLRTRKVLRLDPPLSLDDAPAPDRQRRRKTLQRPAGAPLPRRPRLQRGAGQYHQQKGSRSPCRHRKASAPACARIRSGAGLAAFLQPL